MPVPKLAAVPAVAAAALVAASSALAAPGGLAPPEPATPSGETIRTIYWVVLAACAVVFVLIEATLLLFIVRYRRRPGTPETAEGPQVHGNAPLEIGWTVVPAVALAAIAVFALVKTPDVLGVAGRGEAQEDLRVRVGSHQFYWQYEYPNGVVSLDLLRLPVDRAVALELVSYDVDHSWWAPALTGKLDAIPGRTNVLRFRPIETGTFEGKCAELCGAEHALMLTRVEVLPQEEFDAWLEEEASAQEAGRSNLGAATYAAVCAKCHGGQGEGRYGPPIRGNVSLGEADSLRVLLSEGQNTEPLDGYMPPNLAEGWPDRQFEALLEYLRRNLVDQGGGGGGG